MNDKVTIRQAIANNLNEISFDGSLLIFFFLAFTLCVGVIGSLFFAKEQFGLMVDIFKTIVTAAAGYLFAARGNKQTPQTQVATQNHTDTTPQTVNVSQVVETKPDFVDTDGDGIDDRLLKPGGEEVPPVVTSITPV